MTDSDVRQRRMTDSDVRQRVDRLTYVLELRLSCGEAVVVCTCRGLDARYGLSRVA